MIVAEIPLWFLILVLVLHVLLIIWSLIGEFIIKLIHHKYDLELIKKEEKKEEKQGEE